MRAEQQHESFVRRLQKVLDDWGWQTELIIFVGSMCGSVEEGAFAKSTETLGIAEDERSAIRKRHVLRFLEEQDRVLRSQETGKQRGFL